MKRLLLITTIAAGLIIPGCGTDDSRHSHGEGDDHSHETEQRSHNEVAAEDQHEAGEYHDNAHENSKTPDTKHSHEGSEANHSHSGDHTHTQEKKHSDGMVEPDETYEEVRKGVRLTLSYNHESSTFGGKIENTTKEALPQISVGVQLSNGTKLGPTTPVTLDAGEVHSVELNADGESFESWSAHSTLRSDGHRHGEDGEHEDHH